MIVKIGYKKWDTRDWIQGEELGDKTLACPDCGCRIILKYYDMACGTGALRFCPYCGKRRGSEYEQMTISEVIGGTAI